MAQDPLQPKDDGKVRMPKVDEGMNRIAPVDAQGGKGSKDDDEPKGKDKTEAEKQELLARMRKRFDRCVSAESENRKAALDDLKFKSGEQWPADTAAIRQAEKRPMLTINKIPTFVHQITNDQRQNRPSINISPVGDKGDREAAKMYRGWIRATERESAADIAYDTGFDNAVSNGFGYWRVLSEYESPESFDQHLRIKRIRNPFTVYLDPDHQEPDGADSRFGFVTEMMPRDEFKSVAPNADQMPWTMAGIGEDMKNWITADAIRVVEYYEIEMEPRELVALDNGHIGYEDLLDKVVMDDIAAGRVKVLKRRSADCPKQTWYKATAKELIEEKPWPGKYIPIVQVIGDEIDIQGKVRLSGVIRNAKDPQRMYNYWSPLSLDTPIPTPSGWMLMANVLPGSTVFDEHGRPCQVVGQSPIFINRECFRVTFDDGSRIVADAQHPWTVEERGVRKAATWQWNEKTIATSELTPKKHFIRRVQPLQLPDAPLPIHPYLLGVWLGDGSSAEPQITQSDADVEEMRATLAGFGLDVGMSRKYGDAAPTFTVHGVRKQFAALRLLGNKHIPDIYLRASERQRWMLLQGLMDTDGACNTKTRQCDFTNVSPALVAGFAELLRTLGIRVKYQLRQRGARMFPNGEVYETQDSYQFSFSAGEGDQMFRLARKQQALGLSKPKHWRRTKRHSIVSVEPVPSVPVKCIRVDTPTHLFLAGEGMVPTHNTAETEMIALAPKAPFIMEEGQVEGHEQQWKQANTKSYPYLLYKGTSINGRPAPSPQRQPFQGAPQGIVQAKMGAAQDMMATTGIRFDSTMSERMQDESGHAIRELRRSGDLGSFHYVDNLARSLKHTGAILVDLAPHYLDTPRTLVILKEDDSEERIKIDPHAPKAYQEIKGEDGKTLKVFNPRLGQYGVTVTIGPSYASKRIEASESMMAFARALPNTAQLIADLIAKNQDWPGADEMARRLAKAVPAQYLTPDQKDVPPQVQAVMQHMEEQIKQLSQKLQHAGAALNDRTADRAVAQDKVNKDFEAKLLGILQKSEEVMNKHVSGIADRMLSAFDSMNKQISAPASVNAGAPVDTGSTPPSTTG